MLKICSVKKKRKELYQITDRHLRRLIQEEQEKCIVNLETSLKQPSTSDQLVSITSETSNSSLQNKNTSKTLICNDGPSFSTYSDTINIFDEPLCVTDNLLPEIINNFDSIINSNHPCSTKSSEIISNVETEMHKSNLCDKIRSWAIQFKVSHNCCNSMLKILNSEGLSVPKDIRTLMSAPKIEEITTISNGTYIHLGIENMLLPLLNSLSVIIPNNILKIGINIDGLPLAKSSKSQFYPILISILNIKQRPNLVIPIGIFHGNTKPGNVEEFFNPFVTDLLMCINNGIQVNDNLYRLEVIHVACDAPAKAFLLNVKQFNAYSGCTSCIEEGTYVKNRVVFLGTDSPLRTDESFRCKLDEEYHKGDSPLELLPINIIDTVCLDYMHNCCQGVMKRLLELWVKGKKDVRLSDQSIKEINSSIQNLRSYTPSEFCRLPRPLNDLEFYKATEFRLFLLYSGPIALKGKLKKKNYLHFMLFSFAIRLLICKETCIVYNEQALKFLKLFVNNFSILYGEHLVTYNVHSLIHLPRYVLIHGPLDNFSCFRYENYLQELKKSIKCAKYPLQEAFNRIKEKQQVISNTPYQDLEFKEFTNKPMSSVNVGMYLLNPNNTSDDIKVDICEVKRKCFVIKVSESSSVAILLCHEDE
ncbi:uncharacterized protein LOC126841626 [Adelges cooleyi]|uniref:uncharacterized protein LOC126841626 n=1 Tax=Adelges cooleyi TaxID=133065 RepID=UPI00218016F4|nr:uncharacterized protein LOC126841626 [Adelges cooleyi]